MDEPTLDFIRSLINTHIENARRGLPEGHSGRGSSLFGLNRSLIERAESRMADIDAALANKKDDATRVYAGRALQRILDEVEPKLPFLRPLIESVRREDVPLGLLVSLDMAIEALLPDGADPVVHFDNAHMYWTLDLCNAMRLKIKDKPPVVFFVPVLDPFNALFTPLLVHEIGHTAISQADLQIREMSLIANELSARYLPNAEPDILMGARGQLKNWIDELLCDGLAATICGPAYLFAAAAFLPATAHDGLTGSHPFPNYRLRVVLTALESKGWSPMLAQTCPQTIDWIKNLGEDNDASSAMESFLRNACMELQPAIDSIVQRHIPEALDADKYERIVPNALDQLRIHVPPSEIDKVPLEPWQIILLGWQYSFDLHGDAPSTLALAPKDRDFSQMILRAIEMSQIRRLWSELS